MGAHLGTLWDREDLTALQEQVAGAGDRSPTVFIPLSLVVNPELPDALLGKVKSGDPATRGDNRPSPAGDGLHTEMAMPEGDEVVNMGELPKDEFFGLVSQAGLANI